MGRLQRFLRWGNVILIFLTLLAYLSPYVHPATVWPVSVLGLFYPVLLALNILFIFVWMFKRRAYALFSLGCILLGWTHFSAFIGTHFSEDITTIKEDQIRVLSYNIFGLLNQREEERAISGRRWSKTQLLDFYTQYQPDVWCMQEFSTVPKYADQYVQLITQETPLKYVYYERAKGLAIFSRYPLSAVHMHYFDNNINGFAIADLEKDGRKIRIFDVHLQSNAVSRLANEVAQNGNIQEKKTWLQVKGMVGRYRNTAALRANQALEIRKRLDQSPYPIILCGDFNDIPLSYTYHTLAHGLTDGFRKKGTGMGTTFRGNLPVLRIDYVLSSPQLRPQAYWVLGEDRSDHYPVLSVLQLLKE